MPICTPTLKIMTIDPGSYTPVYLQLADVLRGRITSHVYAPGEPLPSESQLMQEFGVARITVRHAIKELRGEGLVITEPRRGSYVRQELEPDPVTVSGPADVSARMPTPEERRQMGIPIGVPVIVIEREGCGPELLPADRVVLKIPGTA